MATGRVVLDSRGPFANTRLADVGSEKGVKVGNPVMSDRGLVGRVVGVTNGASRVLLLTDVASRTPVLIDRTDARAILLGDGGANPRLAFMRGQNPVKEGDQILTSGDGGVFPRGLPVGQAAKGVDGQWRVRLDSDLTAIDFVRILEFQDFTALVNEPQLEKSPMPPAPAGLCSLRGLSASPAPEPRPRPRPRSRSPCPPPRRPRRRLPSPTPRHPPANELPGRQTAGSLALDRPADPGVPRRRGALRHTPSHLCLQLPEPVFPMAPAFAWAMIRPSVLAPLVLLVMGLFLDLLWGGPIGLWASPY